MKRIEAYVLHGLLALVLACVGGCTKGTADCEANTIFLRLKCAPNAPGFDGAQVECTRNEDGKKFAETVAMKCPGDGVRIGIKVPDYKVGNNFSLTVLPLGTSGIKTTATAVATGECFAWDVAVGSIAQPTGMEDGGVASTLDGGPGMPVDPDASVGQVGSKEMGATCTMGSECANGICADGVCCESKCEEPCFACNQTGSPGWCRKQTKGQRPVGPKTCPTMAASTCEYDGTCDGNGTCAKYEDGIVCDRGRCDGSEIADRKTCQAGVCVSSLGVSCAPYQCDPANAQCFAECSNSAQCVAGRTCDTQKSCGKKPEGAQCSGNSDCLNGMCADGFCCDAACTGKCEACNLPGKQGKCSPVAKDTKDPKSLCTTDPVSSCKQTGSCDGARGCSVYEDNTACRAAGCEGNVATTSGTCDGIGRCAAGPNVACVGATPACVSGQCFACKPGDTSTCGATLGAKGTCANGTVTCGSSGTWGACSVTPAAKDTCTPGNDDDCSGGHTACACGGFIMPNTPSLGLPNPASYDTSMPGIVVDRVSKLMWEHPVAATIYPADAFGQAAAYCVGLRLGGFADWRIPTRSELSSIVDETRTAPAISAEAFAGTPYASPTAYYWTSSTVPGTGGQFRVISFGAGSAALSSSTLSMRLRCVRQPQPQCYPVRFEVRAGGIVYDASTELSWRQELPTTTLSLSAASAFCDGLGGGYRLPAAKELVTILDDRYTKPAIDFKIFPSSPSACFWSSTTLVGTQADGWMVDFANGNSTPAPGTSLCWARCVR